MRKKERIKELRGEIDEMKDLLLDVHGEMVELIDGVNILYDLLARGRAGNDKEDSLKDTNV